VHARELVRRHFPALTTAPVPGPAAVPAPAAPVAAAPREGAAPDHPQIRDWLVARVAQRLGVPVAEIDAAAPLDTYPLESLAIVQIIADLSGWLDWDIAPAVLIEYPTIDEVARAIADDLTDDDLNRTSR
jgi:acyl carrier protein